MNFSINDLKKHLGPGLGLRKNRYLVEIPAPTNNGETINMLCQSAGLPERNITTTDVWHKGRRYQVRGETDFIGEYEISIIDDDKMKIRQMFDDWMKKVDNTKPNGGGGGASFESNGSDNPPTASYQADINIWQMDNPSPQGSVDSQKIYGYKLQNAFPKQVGIVTLEDNEENTLSEFSVTFAFSEFIPLYG